MTAQFSDARYQDSNIVVYGRVSWKTFEGFIVGGDELSFLSICQREERRGDCGYQVE